MEEEQLEMVAPLADIASEDLDEILYADDELFDCVAPGVYAWRPADAAESRGLAGARLADERGADRDLA